MEILFFCIIAAMRVIQAICKKKTSNLVNGQVGFFHYATFNQFMAAIFSLIALCFVGFSGLNTDTWICAFVIAILFAVDLFTGLEVIKGCSLIFATMFSLGGLIVSCVTGIFFFNEPMSVWQWIGLVLFFVAAYLLGASEQKEQKEKKPKNKISVKTWIMLFLNMLANGFVAVVQKYFGLYVKNGNISMLSFLTFLSGTAILGCGLLVSLRMNKNKAKIASDAQESEKFEKLSNTLLVCAILLAFALFVINLLVTELGKTVPSAILFPVSSAICILVTTIVGWIVFKEKMSLKNIIGLVLGALSVIMLGAFAP